MKDTLKKNPPLLIEENITVLHDVKAHYYQDLQGFCLMLFDRINGEVHRAYISTDVARSLAADLHISTGPLPQACIHDTLTNVNKEK